MIISFSLMTLKFDSGVILLGEIRCLSLGECKHESKIAQSFFNEATNLVRRCRKTDPAIVNRDNENTFLQVDRQIVSTEEK